MPWNLCTTQWNRLHAEFLYAYTYTRYLTPDNGTQLKIDFKDMKDDDDERESRARILRKHFMSPTFLLSKRTSFVEQLPNFDKRTLYCLFHVPNLT